MSSVAKQTPFELARGEERTNRLLAYLPLAPRLCGQPAVPITARHVYEFEASRNPLFMGGRPNLNDIEALLWRLHPDFRRPTGELPNLTGNRPRPSWLRCWFAHRRIVRHIGRREFNILASLVEIKGRIATSYQDQAADVSDGKGLRSPLAADRHWIESFFIFFCGEFGWSTDVVLDSPISRLFQLYREYCFCRGIAAPFIAPSDGLIGPPPS